MSDDVNLIGGAPIGGSRGLFSIRRVGVLGYHTFQQLVRMRVFYFLAIFAVILIASSLFVLRYNSPEQELKILKDFGLGAMTLFVSVFAVVATSMLIPKDIEDRTLYTVLSKPVLRIEYLLGKLVGVVALLGVSLVVMDALFTGVLYLREVAVMDEQVRQLEAAGYSDDAIEAVRQLVSKAGVTWSLQVGVFAVLCKGVVLAALTLLVSTVASSSLFTMVVAITAFFVGHVQADVRAFYEASGLGGGVMSVISAVMVLMFPDFQMFNVVDAAVGGEVLGWDVAGTLGGLAGGYVLVYVLLAWVAFFDKEL
ncbi:ABC transporter permease [Sulfuriroseicoccus oceanibius]|uniref:ABC transporter permease subunit n=1 Tax=Sulfuriroseicoccus oceanibius TaxID=2707525 RepID=A0A6B3L5S8_9BACT|nr:ABC transporter permease subunit [Sulfuriroseicoccus oceanibius]QQL45757.1 ABC transporter permease subunit [Sulfuriroseicoccus oceanibius]